MSELDKVSLYIEVWGEDETGKSTYGSKACAVAHGLYLDTTPKKESKIIIQEIVPDWKERYIWITALNDCFAALTRVEGNPDKFKTVIVDTHADLQRLAVLEWLKENPDRKVPQQIEYGIIREKIDKFVTEVCKKNLNLIFMCGMKDEYKRIIKSDGKTESVRTERRIRESTYDKVRKGCDLRFRIEFAEVSTGEKVDTPEGKKDKMKLIRRGVIVKNRRRDRTNSDPTKLWINEMPSLDWKGTLEALRLKEEEVIM